MTKTTHKYIKTTVLTLLILCMYGCSPSPLLPEHEINLEDHIPVITDQEENEPAEQTISIEEPTLPDWFTQKRFPGKCTWKNLVRTVDGDTIIVEPDNRVRLIGVDTPETKHPEKPIQEGGLEASAFTKEFLKNETEICLIRDRIGDPYDHYGRILGYIYTADGRDLNAELVLRGYGVAMEGFMYERRVDFLEYEKYAQSLNAGIWKERN